MTDTLCAPKRRRASFQDTGAALRNPGMGWIFHTYDNSLERYGADLAPSDTLDEFPGLTVSYLRISWSVVQPERDRFDWSRVDTQIQKWARAGIRTALRFTCSETDGASGGTPDWVRQEGAQGTAYFSETGPDPAGDCWEPDFNDPVFLKHLGRFLDACADRFDGHPLIEFIDVGSFGVWGEGHTFWSTRNPYDAETVIRHLELHRNAFSRTLLVANQAFADHGRGEETLHRARELGLGFRSDGILVLPTDELFKPHLARPFHATAPVILESHHYEMSVQDGVWEDGLEYLRAVKAYGASYASIHGYPRNFLNDNQALVDAINRVLGYRLCLREVEWPEALLPGEDAEVRMVWENAGVAPCLPGGHVALAWLDADGGIARVQVDAEWDVRNLGPGETVERALRIDGDAGLSADSYRLAVSVGDKTGTPRIALPLTRGLEGPRYVIGPIDARG